MTEPLVQNSENPIEKIIIGIDLGSITAKVVFLDQEKHILEHHYLRHKGHPGETLLHTLEDMFTRFPAGKIYAIGITGSGGKRVAPLLNARFINEVIAETIAVNTLYDGVRSIINIGGQDSKLIHFHNSASDHGFVIENFSMNTLCAAGTGAFLDQQATRLGVNIEGEFGELAIKARNSPRIAGRCSVFAKSDMIHLQQKGTPLNEIIAGLCDAMARNFKATIGKNTQITPKVAFIGGVANNRGMIKAFQEVLRLQDGELIIPRYNGLIGAIGAAFYSFDRSTSFPGLQRIKDDLLAVSEPELGFSSLRIRDTHLFTNDALFPLPKETQPVEVFLGVDVGSITTKLLIMDREHHILAKKYLRTGSQPIEAVKQGFRELGHEFGDHIRVMGACTTGSARYLIGDFIGADLVKDEITTHARGAREIDPHVDTIFEIGGQDSKFISIENGAIVDFEMNKVCAAGTGSFIEEQAERLGIRVEEEFAAYALKAKSPCRCGERCTVFMESDLLHHQQKGVPRDDIVAGLTYSIVFNYLNKVVEGRRIGQHIFFQGGVAYNKAVVAAFEAVLGQPITVPPHHENMGAYGAALLVSEAHFGSKSKFKGWQAAEEHYSLTTFECQHCPNQCTVNKVTFGENSVFYYGSRCDRYDFKKTKANTVDIPDYFAIRDDLLRTAYPNRISPGTGRGIIGIPFSMITYEDLPVWTALFTELGYEIVLSTPTNQGHIKRGLETVVEETCFPIKVMHGHVLELVEKGVDYLFLPYMMDIWNDSANVKESLVCTYVQAAPDLIRAAIDLTAMGIKPLSPIIKPSVGEKFLVQELYKVLGPELDVSEAQIRGGLRKGKQALDSFRAAIQQKGKKALTSLGNDEIAIVIISKPYNGPDRGVNLDLPRKFNNLGVKVIPLDFLPLQTLDVQAELPHMYWWYGHRALGAAKFVRDHPQLYAVYVNNFACGPDSFILQYFQHMMGNKPNLILEIDEHSADAGMMTRAEAFLDSVRFLQKQRPKYSGHELPVGGDPGALGKSLLKTGKTLYLPHINNDHVYSLEAAFKANGINAQVLPETDDDSLLWARKYTNNKECYPYVLMTGDIIKMTHQPGFDPNNSTFFMAGASGVCRLNHYESMQRLVLHKLGFPQVEVYAPTAEKALNDVGRINLRLPIDSWTSITATDCLFAAYCQTKPYEIEPGSTDRVFTQAKVLLCEALLHRRNIHHAMKLARILFESVYVNKSVQKPRIGIIGEFYLRWHPYSNNHIFKLIQQMGGEVVAPSVSENMLHFNHTILDDLRRKKRTGSVIELSLSGAWQRFHEHQIYAPFADFLEIYPQPSVQELENLAAPYANEIIENEITISIGKARWLAQNRMICGIINLIPFTCLLGTPIASLLKRLKEDYPNIAVATFKFDGAPDVNIITRLEAFMHQAHQYLGDQAVLG